MTDAWIEPALALFRAACELPPDERPAFLDRECGADVAIRRHVEAMLARDTGPAASHDTAAHPVRAALAGLADHAESGGDVAAGLPERIGGHRIVRRVAQGGMGVVYEARQEHPDRRVAIKVARTGGTTDERARRFELEAQLLARLGHPGIAQIFAAGTTPAEDGAQPFIVMEFVAGRSLTDFAERHLHTAREKLELMIRVCDAVGFAHRQGVVHRDLKPDNVLVDAEGAPKVLDFGIAKVEAAGGFGAATLRTEAGRILGTLGYMAPEQLGGKTDGLGPEADVYSLGVMIYQLLSGRLPHELDGVTLTRALAVVSTTDAPLLGVVRPEYRGDIEAVVAKALEKDHRHRYADAAELQQDLERYLRGEPIRARPAGPLRRATKWARRYPALATAVCGLFVVLAASAGILLWKNHEVRVALEQNERLLDRTLVKQAHADADVLWPTRREQVPGLRQWVTTYRDLVARRHGYAEAVDAMRDQAGTPEYDALAKLVHDLGLLASDPILARVDDRLRLAESIDRITVDERTADWEAARRRVRENPDYHGLDLKPQLGLVPLGRDPDSGLEEFLHFETHVGPIPRRDEREQLPPLDGDTGLVFVLIPGGKPGEPFWMGAQKDDAEADSYDPWKIDKREDLHEEPTVEPFLLSKFEMTQGQWERFVGTNPSEHWPSPTRPVNRVSWIECEEVLRKLALTLPHEVQWEYAARAGGRHAWWTGPDPRSLEGAENLFDEAAAEHNEQWSRTWGAEAAPWYDEAKAQRIRDGKGGPAPVGTYRSNGFGLFDVGGNVAEWCANRFGYGKPPPRHSKPKRVIRGSSFKKGVDEARAAARRDTEPSFCEDEIGVRPAMTLAR